MKEISQTTKVPSVFSKYFKYLNAGSNSPLTVSCENSTASTTTQQSALFKLYFNSAIFPNQTSNTLQLPYSDTFTINHYDTSKPKTKIIFRPLAAALFIINNGDLQVDHLVVLRNSSNSCLPRRAESL